VRGESFLRHATEAAATVRGVVFTHREDLLASYDKDIKEGQSDLLALSDLDAGDPGRLQEVTRIRAEFEHLQMEWALPALEKVRSGMEFKTTPVLLDGQERLTTIRTQVLRLRDEDEEQNVSEMLNAEKVIRRMLVVGVGLAVLLAGILIFLTGVVTRLIVAPVLQLIRASEQVGRGDYAPTLPPVADNEFGVLSRSFAQMTTALRREHEEIASLNRFSEAVTQCTSEVEVYDLLLHSLRERFQPQQVIIFKLDPAENYLEVASTLVPLSAEVGAWPVIEEPQNCKAVRSGRSFVVNDVQIEPLCPSKFVQQANIDALTGLYNRRFLEDYARKLFAIARRRAQPVGVIMLDLDHFKSFNDIFGHEIGDRILRHFAKTMTGCMRETNLAARYGGEEFVVILPDTSTQACTQVAERIRKAVMTMVVPSNTEKPLPQLTVSIGVVTFPEHGQTLEEVIQASDKALYESKRGGRNRVTVAPKPESAAG